ncbi:MAG: hypothetical protein HC827_18490, partial [Cyanobacteria bacterium RM1_2_2]|nr:hypothetical protein [Cyanobacteria bacterium RM1_2_2]
MKLNMPADADSQSRQRHLIALAMMLLLGLGLRLWHLDSKPLWLDEVLSALFTMGRSYADVPLDQFFPLTELAQVFTVQPDVSWGEITQRVATESVHPPIFFCLMYSWMRWLVNPTEQPTEQPAEHWIFALRLLPALFGVGAIAAIYWLNRVAFSPKAGLLAATLMAVSPFAVYLSQEARHYTLPMLLITLALAALVQMQHLIQQKQLRPLVWGSWSLFNLLGLYTHYFCLLALIAQIGALTLWMLWHRHLIRRQFWIAWGLVIAAIGIGYLPWLPTLISHFSRPETDWLIPYKPDWLDRVEPLYQTLVGWTLMVIALPVEDQPNWIAIPASLLMLAFMIWLAWQLKIGFKALWQNLANRPATLLIGGFTGFVLLQFFAIVYLLDKDLTVVPRYNFVYYPGVCALLAACFSSRAAAGAKRYPVMLLLLAGLVSSIAVVHGGSFQKSYYPDQVAQDFAFDPNQPLAVVMTYRSPQEVALGLSFALELAKRYPPETENQTVDQQVRFAFLDRTDGYSEAWKNLSDFDQPLPPPLNLWAIASPGMRTKDYPQRLRLNAPLLPPRAPKC